MIPSKSLIVLNSGLLSIFNELCVWCEGLKLFFFFHMDIQMKFPSNYIGLLYLVKNETEQEKSNLLVRDSNTNSKSMSKIWL